MISPCISEALTGMRSGRKASRKWEVMATLAAAATAVGCSVRWAGTPAWVRAKAAMASPANAAKVTSRFTKYRAPTCAPAQN